MSFAPEEIELFCGGFSGKIATKRHTHEKEQSIKRYELLACGRLHSSYHEKEIAIRRLAINQHGLSHTSAFALRKQISFATRRTRQIQRSVFFVFFCISNLDSLQI